MAADDPDDAIEDLALEPDSPAAITDLFADAATGDKVAAALIDAMAADHGLLPVERTTQLLGIDPKVVHSVLAERIARAERDLAAGSGGDREAWIRGMKELGAATPTREQQQAFDRGGGPAILEIERQFQLQGIQTRPQAYLDRLDRLLADFEAARGGDVAAAGRAAAAFGVDPAAFLADLRAGGRDTAVLEGQVRGAAEHPAGPAVGVPGGSSGDAPSGGSRAADRGLQPRHDDLFPRDSTDPGDGPAVSGGPAGGSPDAGPPGAGDPPAPSPSPDGGGSPAPDPAPDPAPEPGEGPAPDDGPGGSKTGPDSSKDSAAPPAWREGEVTGGELEFNVGYQPKQGVDADTYTYPDGSVLRVEHGTGHSEWIKGGPGKQDDKKDKDQDQEKEKDKEDKKDDEKKDDDTKDKDEDDKEDEGNKDDDSNDDSNDDTSRTDVDPSGYANSARLDGGLTFWAEQQLVRGSGDTVAPWIILDGPPGAEHGTATLDHTTGDPEVAVQIVRPPAPKDPIPPGTVTDGPPGVRPNDGDAERRGRRGIP